MLVLLEEQTAEISTLSPQSRANEFTWLNPIAPKPINPNRSFTSRLRLRDFGPIFQEDVDADVSQGVIVKLLEHIEGHRDYVGADQGCFQDVLRMTDGGGEDLS